MSKIYYTLTDEAPLLGDAFFSADLKSLCEIRRY